MTGGHEPGTGRRRPGPAPSRSAIPHAPDSATYPALAAVGSDRSPDRLAAGARRPGHAPGPATALRVAALGLHRRRRGAARPRRAHRLRLRHRAARLVRRRAHYRVHDRPGHRWARLPAARHGRRRHPLWRRAGSSSKPTPMPRPVRRGAIRRLCVDHCILGPVRTRFGGSVETLSITDSIVQGLPATAASDFTAADVFDPSSLVTSLLSADPVSVALSATGWPARLRPTGRVLRASISRDVLAGSLSSRAARQACPRIGPGRGSARRLTSPVRRALLNRARLEESFPVALSPAAVAVADAAVELTRVTVLGRMFAHRLSASDSILAGLTAVEDTQAGCVRFSAYASGSVIPAPYRSAIDAGRRADLHHRLVRAAGVRAAARNCRRRDRRRRQGRLHLRGRGDRLGSRRFLRRPEPGQGAGPARQYAEYMPLGLMPVIVHVT